MVFGRTDTARRRRRWLLGLGTAALTAALMSSQAAQAAPAAAAKAPTRSDGVHDVVFVHGYDFTGKASNDCASTWKAIKAQVSSSAHRRITWGYYSGDTHCDYKYNGNRNTSINTLAQAFSQFLYTQFRNKPVDVVAHSMGGLILRRAIAGSQRREKGFAYPLYVEDAVTLGTPHAGTGLARACGVGIGAFLQCKQMSPGSDLLKGLAKTAQNPQSAFGTDWTVIGSEGDKVVSDSSAISMNAGHKMVYLKTKGRTVPGHSQLHEALSNMGKVKEYDFNRGKNWTVYAVGWTPASRVALATFYWRTY